MSDGWLDEGKYERIPILDCTGPGSMSEGFAWKAVLHTTESQPGSLDAVTALFRAKPCYAPQFALDVATKRRAQYIPWTWSGAALQGCHRGSQTNRGRAIQVEMVGRAAETPDWSDEWLWEVADWLADLVRDGAPIDLNRVFDFGAMTGVLAIEDTPYRLSEGQFQGESGVIGHVNTHCNEHWDPGKINGVRILEMAREILGGNFTAPASSDFQGPASSAPASVQAEHMRLGMEGGIVAFAQELLAGLGYDLGDHGADGVFGEVTEAAVRAFQSASGLEADGIIGPLTQAAIAAAYGRGGGLPSGDVPPFPGRYFVAQDPQLSGDDVREWQAKMAERGWPIGVDGVYGPESEDRCVQFQGEKLLTVDGVVGPLTWQAAWTAPVT